MNLKLLKFSFHNLRSRKLRSWLTILGVVIGIAAVVALMQVGQGLENAVTEQFQKVGFDKVIISPSSEGAFGGVVSADKFDDHDLDVIRKARGIDRSGGMMFKTTVVEYKGEKKSTFIIGMSDELTIVDFAGIDLESGRGLKKSDNGKAVIGYDIAIGKFFKDIKAREGKDIIIQGKSFQIVGVMGKIGNPQDDSQIYVTMEDAQVLFNEKGYTMIAVKTKAAFEPSAVAEDIKQKLRKDRNEKEGEESFSVQTYEQLLQTFNSILGIIQLVIVGIATISLLVGGIGIMNTMYTSVLERTRQIGIMKAVGAKNKHILMIFIFEAGIIGLVGGAIGTILGVLASKSVGVIASLMGFEILKVTINWNIIIFALGFAFFIGLVSGLTPAIQASRSDPVEALRYE